MSELKCCPFCSSNNIKVGSVGNSLGIDNYIKCVDCGAKIQICDGYGMEHLEKLWNRRKPMANIVEKLEEKHIDIIGNTSLHYLYSEGYIDALDYVSDIAKQEINNGLE